MPDDEMEMAVDFGPVGFGEDIDIDLDFPAGEPDEDMDLGEFDRPHDIHNFNSDTRDELMAEVDDASYGMIDAIETDHDALAAAANDIDIEIEHAVESIWQQNLAHPADLNQDTDIDYLDEAIAETMDAEKNDIETSEWLPAGTDSEAADVINHDFGVSAEIFSAAQGQQEELPLEEPAIPHRETSEPAKAPHSDAEAAYYQADLASEEVKHSSDVDDLSEDVAVEIVAQAPNGSPSSAQHEHDLSQPNTSADIKTHASRLNSQEPNEQQGPDYSDDVVQTRSHHGDESHESHDVGRPEHPDATEPSGVEENHADAPLLQEADESADDNSEYQLGGGLYVEATNDQTGADDDAASEAEASELGGFDPQPVETSSARDLEDSHDKPETAIDLQSSSVGVGDRDDPIELADYYGIYISYGETDYRLFAKSEDDDPNQYFLSDKSALDASLTQFLTNLREVISEEISPLDDLVLQVDGLGLEFSESTTPDFLGKFTFGDLVVLYDKLVKNEPVEPPPPIYTYLTVKPNCTRRMMALGESANAGRGLSEVALYHDSSSIDGEQVDDVRSLDTDSLTGGHNAEESASIYPPEDEEEEEEEEGNEINDDEEHNPPLVSSEDVLDRNEPTDEFDNDSEQNPAEGSADVADHAQAISTSKQGICPLVFSTTHFYAQKSACSCEDCYELELRHLAKPIRAKVWPTPGIVMPTHNPTHMTWMANRTITEDDATSESSGSQPQEASGREEQPSSNMSEINDSKLHTPKIASNQSTDFQNSDNTSVTVTLDGEDNDEIDYSSDEDDESNHDATNGSTTQKPSSATATELNVFADDEITWESDDEEDVNNASKDGLTTDTVQVSPVSGKRTRSDSDALDDVGDKNDYKRRRS
ncbi:hypothetical protein F5Y14DRAFT_444126 [Nemania sp. NC0429]|nr:hypothetical protein F5Y14DRAFT_444126 [Nemania sp. NC0429]